MTFGERLKQLRNEKKLSQEELANMLGYQRSTLANWEIDRAAPDPETLIKLATFFDVSIDYLLRGRTPSVYKQPASYDTGPPPAGPMDELTDEEKKEVLQYIEWLKSRRQFVDEQAASASGQ